MAIKYRYALNSAQGVVDIHSLSPERRAEGAPFTCLGCSAQLVPRLGQSRRKHFAHKVEQACSVETYLHRAAKQAFAEAYQNALVTGEPFSLTRTVTIQCNFFEKKLGFRCHRRHPETHDLTDFFDQATLECSVGDYRADVLLSSSKHKNVILVEFAVNHPCEPDKINSGYRIIEFDIQDEQDVERLRSRSISEGGEQRVRMYNFSETSKNAPICRGKCDRKVNMFLVYPSGKSILVGVEPGTIIKRLVGPTAVHREVLGLVYDRDGQIELYRQKVREAHFNGVRIQNCFLCRYHGGDGIENAVYFKIRKESHASNDAVGCAHYRLPASPSEYAQIDAVNDAYVRKHRQRLWHHYIRKFL